MDATPPKENLNDTIVLVDDSKDNLIVTQDVLLNSLPDVEIVTFDKPQKVMDFLCGSTVSLAVIDVQMPGINGIELCSLIKTRKETQHIHVILITSHNAPSSLKAAGLEAGADDFVTRPVDNTELVARVKVALRINRAESELRHNAKQAQQDYKQFFDKMLSGIAVHEMIVNADGKAQDYRFLSVNPAFEMLTTLRADDIVGKTVLEVLPNFKPKWIERYEHVITTGEPVHSEDYSEALDKHFEVVAFRLSDGKFATSFTNITERKRAEDELALANSFLQRVIDGLPESVMVINRDYTVALANRAAREGTRQDPVSACLTCHQVSHLSETPCDDKEHPCPLTVVAETRGPCTVEHIHHDATGKERFVDVVAVPVFNEQGDLIQIIESCRDITERKKLEEKLHQADKMKAIGHLAGGIAHDFNNILGGIIGYADMSLEQIEKGTRLEKNMNQILKAGDRATNLVSQILTFSRQSTDIKVPLYLNPILNEALQLLRASLPSTVDITSNLHREEKPVVVNATKIHEIVMNLCTNAADAMDERGVIDISCVEEEIEVELEGLIGTIEPGSYAVIAIKDNGCGMTKEILSHIFEPFYTTKGVGKGTGMGLSVVFGIVQGHGGNIGIESEVGKGTTIKILLPKTDEGIDEDYGRKVQVRGGKERILVVDDEEMLCDLAKDMLSEMGYNVTRFNDSQNALNAFKNAPDSFDLVITDQTMPRMTGIELSDELLSIRKDIPIIICTGYSKEVDEKKAIEYGIREFVMKPIRKRDVADRIRHVLDG